MNVFTAGLDQGPIPTLVITARGWYRLLNDAIVEWGPI